MVSNLVLMKQICEQALQIGENLFLNNTQRFIQISRLNNAIKRGLANDTGERAGIFELDTLQKLIYNREMFEEENLISSNFYAIPASSEFFLQLSIFFDKF